MATGSSCWSTRRSPTGLAAARGSWSKAERCSAILSSPTGSSAVPPTHPIPAAPRARRAVVRDLTSQHEWAEALKRSRLRFQRLFADAPVGIALLGISGRIEEANRALGELLGTAAAELIGRGLADFVIGEDRDQVKTHIAEASL